MKNIRSKGHILDKAKDLATVTGVQKELLFELSKMVTVMNNKKSLASGYLNSFFSSKLFEQIMQNSESSEIELKGITSLFLLDVGTNDFNNFLILICQRNKISFDEIKLIRNLITCYFSKNSDDIIRSMQSLGLSKCSKFLLVGKGLLDLKYMPLECFYG